MTASDKETADLLGHHFENMFTNEDTDSIPSAQVPDALWDDSNMDFSVSCVTNKLMKLHTDKSMGPDGIHPLLLKECATTVAKPLALIFNKSYTTGTLPSDWKIAKVVPIFKKGSRTDKANYRPISLTSIPCKIMEPMIKDKMQLFLDRNNSITEAQHGFVSERSCLTNPLEALE